MSPFARARLVLAAVTALAVTTAAGQQRGFTLEQALNAPFPEELVAAPTGGAVAWVFNAQGARNIWIAAPPDYRGKPVTAYTDDDGQEITDLRWTPDARGIVYVRGGGANRSGEYPNPHSVAGGVEQAVWVVPAAGGSPRRIGEGHSPVVSPKGDRVAFVKRGQVWSASLTDSTAASEQLFKARGTMSGLRWAPDGAQLAVVSDRGDHSFIGVYDVSTKVLRFLDASVDSDDEPAWAPDGRRVAFIRTPAATSVPFTPRRAAEPWSIRIADVATGTGREVWRADTGTGSAFRGVVADGQLVWGGGDRLIFPWEKDGWTHLYGVSTQGGRAVLLTPGAFEVEYVAPSTDRGTIFFTSNQDDIDRRHIWRVAATGGSVQAVTRGTGIEWAPAPLSDGKSVVLLQSDARKPPRPAIVTAAGGGAPRDLAPQVIPADFPEAGLVEPQPVLVSASDGMQIHAQLFLPKNLRPGERRPAVVFFHGGSRRQMLLGWHYMYYYRNAYALNQYLASRGYIVLSVNYRSGIGYGMEFREALHYGAQGASEFNDVLGAGLYLRSRADVDPKRIGLWGGSYGGFLTALGLARASDLFAAGVDLHGVHDWHGEIRNWTPTWNPAVQEEGARVAFQSSPIAYVKDWRSPVLLIHGDDDRNVPFSQSVDLAAALRQQGVEIEQLIFPDEVHDFLTHAHWLQAYHAAVEFFGRRLGSAPTAADRP